MSKFTYIERNLIRDIVAILTIKRIPDSEFIKSVFDQTNKKLTVREITRVKQKSRTKCLNYHLIYILSKYKYPVYRVVNSLDAFLLSISRII
jgi:hypothetical protein